MDRRWFLSTAFACPLIASDMTGEASEGKGPRTSELAPAYPPSPVIAGIDWAPVDTVVRQAKDGDNWPVTWADDDALYTTFGDGTGFAPKTQRKLSFGFARVTGAPEDFTGTSVRCAAQQLGDGRKGKKGWGILSVGGVLYLWFGHADGKGGGAHSIRRGLCRVRCPRALGPVDNCVLHSEMGHRTGRTRRFSRQVGVVRWAHSVPGVLRGRLLLRPPGLGRLVEPRGQ